MREVRLVYGVAIVELQDEECGSGQGTIAPIVINEPSIRRGIDSA